MPIRMRTIPTRTTRTRITRTRIMRTRITACGPRACRSHACGPFARGLSPTSRPMQRTSRSTPSRRSTAATLAVNGRTPRTDYDDPPRRKRGSSLVTAVILIGCAMLGTAGAYGYRTYATAPSSKPAPVIIADSAPSKIVPAGRPEVRALAGSRRRRPGQRRAAGFARRAAGRLAGPGRIGSARGVPIAGQPSRRRPRPAPRRRRRDRLRRSVDRAEAGPHRHHPSGGRRQQRPAVGQRTRLHAPAPPAARRPPTQPPPRATRDQPLSLDPNAAAPPNEPARAQPQQRALTPPAPRETAAPAAAPAPRVAAVPPSGGTGGYLVQVSSQRSEADAQASYRALQAKYSQLKSHQPIIRRADLGSKGIYYRAMVGRSNRARMLFSSATGSSRPAGSASSFGTDGAIVCRNRKQRLDPRGSGG